MKTRKRFRAHQSIHREITLHPSRGVYAQLLADDELPVLFCEDGDLPGAPIFKLSRTVIEPVALVAESDGYTHRGHTHRRHRSHKKGHGDFRAGDGGSTRIREFSR